MGSLIELKGKPIEKLIEVVSNGIGTLYEPTKIKRAAKAKAYELKVLERAKTEASIENKRLETEFLTHIENRFIYQETNRQNNIENVVQIAAEQLSQEETVSESEVNQDWTTRFFNIVQDVSGDDMQKLWSRILAGEVKQPNSFSLRTLDILKNLTKDEAEVFNKVAPYAIVKHPGYYFLAASEALIERYLDKKIVWSKDDFHLLIEIGLLNEPRYFPRTDSHAEYHNGDFFIETNFEYRGEAYMLTKSAIQLLSLFDPINDQFYMQTFGGVCVTNGLFYKRLPNDKKIVLRFKEE